MTVTSAPVGQLDGGRGERTRAAILDASRALFLERGYVGTPINAITEAFSYARGLRHRLGRVYINFGSPVPLYERIVGLRAEGLTDRQVVERIALDVCHRLNRQRR
jgi:hypothetical protein